MITYCRKERDLVKLLVNALVKYIMGVVLVGLVLFLPAGTLNYPGGLLFCALLFIPMLILGAVLFIKAKGLLERRLDTKEKQTAQKGVVAFSALCFLSGFVLAGLDFRFSLSKVPTVVVIIASAVFLVSYALYCEVMRENEYLSRTVKVEDGQKVIDTGLYSVVRHPMYAVTVLMFLSIPLILGSWYSFIVFLHYPVIIVFRIVNEEKLLERELSGYTEYKKKVKYRLIPFVW